MQRFLALLALASLSVFSSSDTPVFNKRDRAFYADPALVNFVRPGLSFTLTGASLGQDGTIQAMYTVTDPQGLPLDIKGVTTPGTISTSFIASYVPKGKTDYIAMTTRSQTGAVSGTAIQPSADSGGTTTLTAPGAYTYTFKTKAPAGFDRTQTVTIGLYGSRDLSAFGLGSNSSNAELNFTPDGSGSKDVHEVVRTETCNKCHDPLAAHGGSRRDVALCVLCHNPGGGGTQTIDPDTGNSIDLKVMIHKIHMGSSLPSVIAGHPYQIIGFQQSVNDWSTVVFPPDPRNCQMCHEIGAPPQGGTWPPGSQAPPPTTPPAQATWWLTNPTMASCGACHDDVNFQTGENHANLPQPNDNQCTHCHFPQGELPFDVSVIGAHTIPQFAPGLAGVAFTLVKVDNGVAGKSPTVTFTLKDKSGAPIDPKSMGSLSLVMAGPTSDYAAYVSESAISKATCNGGTCTYTYTATVPAGATGTYTIGIEGYKNATLLPGTTQQMSVRDVGYNQTIDFSVDGSPVAPHSVDTMPANCNACHYYLSVHGTIRNNTQHCILCHNPNGTDVARRPASASPPQSINFPLLIHRIHKGEQSSADNQPQLTPFIVYGFNNSVNDFSDVRFPGDLRNCDKCHLNETQTPPLPSGRMMAQTPRSYINPSGPTTVACTACHLSKDASAHAKLNSDPTLGEACSVCHGASSQFSVDSVHARSL
jgi:OmcA/MtrC family decaheme c-type cytochrome